MSEQLVTPENVTTKDGKINLLDLNRQQMREFFKDLGEKPFRADQVMKWMYHYCCDNFDEMTDINKVLRGKLKEVAEIRAPEVVEEQRSSDGTIKWAIAVGDQRVETVYIPEDDRATLCVSSQVGCALECKFCSTAQQGFNRNLRVSEIIGQVWRAARSMTPRAKSSPMQAMVLTTSTSRIASATASRPSAASQQMLHSGRSSIRLRRPRRTIS